MMPAGPSPSNRPASAARGREPGRADHQREHREHRRASAASAKIRPELGSWRASSHGSPAAFLQASGLAVERICGTIDAQGDSMHVRQPASCERALQSLRCSCVGACAVCTRRARAPPIRRAASCRSTSAPTSSWLRSPTRTQIAGLSPYAADPDVSIVADKARAFRRLGWQAESVIPLDPDLVLVGSWDRSLTQRMLRALGFRVVAVDVVADLDGARAQIREVAALLGHPERGEALIARDRSRARSGWRGAAAAGRPRSWSAMAATRSAPRVSPPR